MGRKVRPDEREVLLEGGDGFAQLLSLGAIRSPLTRDDVEVLVLSL
jgi:hypothetical protein